MLSIKSLIWWSLTGPCLIWLLLLSHVMYHHLYTIPAPIPGPVWPKDTQSRVKAAMQSSRQFILEDFVKVFKAELPPEKFLALRATEDIVFEDPLERFEGREDVSQFLSMCKYLSGFNFEIYQEVHSVHEVLLDWRLTFGLAALGPSGPQMSIPMRTHIMLEPAEKPGAAEKIFLLPRIGTETSN